MYDNGQGNDTALCGYVDITALNPAFGSIFYVNHHGLIGNKNIPIAELTYF